MKFRDVDQEKCSCTLAWILRNSFDFYFYDCFKTYNISWYWANCAFDQRLDRCERIRFTAKAMTSAQTSIYKRTVYARKTISTALKVAKLYTVTLAKPFLCVTCAILSILTIFNIRVFLADEKKTDNNSKSRMYGYISAAAVVDIIIALIYLTEILNECIEPHGMLCGEFRKKMQIFRVRFLKRIFCLEIMI